MARLYSRREEEEEEPLGRPALAVHGEPSNEDSPPSDGHEYLRRVRKQALALPQVVSVPIGAPELRAADERSAARLRRSLLDERAADLPPPPPAVRPAREWQQQLLAAFAEARRSVERSSLGMQAERRALPRPHDVAGWALCLGLGRGASRAGGEAGKEEEEGEGEGEGEGEEMGVEEEGGEAHAAEAEAPREARPPLMSFVSQLDQQRAVAVLALLSSRLRKDGHATPTVGRWLFAVLARLEKELGADEAATVRSLLKTCWELRARRAEELGREDAARVPSDVATLNLLITITGGFFGQASSDEWLTP
ncbi:hypothetical protein AB1Y20_006941 [Prymnesium parvum]|uniref:Gem-associated protein 2 n=1 Tax=Prymnesium parvum TaxID=97485 RepID=A0AB34IZV4_PRYPA